MIHTGRGCAGRVRGISEATLKAAEGGEGKRRRTRMIHKTSDTGGAGRVSC